MRRSWILKYSYHLIEVVAQRTKQQSQSHTNNQYTAYLLHDNGGLPTVPVENTW